MAGFVRLLNFNSHARTGTMMMLNTKVDRIPTTSVNPTERMGIIGTIAGAINTANPTTVVMAEITTATPVDFVISITHSRYITGSQRSGISSAGNPFRLRRSFSSVALSIRFRLTSSIRFIMCRA